MSVVKHLLLDQESGVQVLHEALAQTHVLIVVEADDASLEVDVALAEAVLDSRQLSLVRGLYTLILGFEVVDSLIRDGPLWIKVILLHIYRFYYIYYITMPFQM